MSDTTSLTAETPETSGLSGQQDWRPTLSMVGENTMLIQTPHLQVGVTTASGLRIWGTDSTEIAFGEPGPRPDLLPKTVADNPRVHSRYFAVYDRSHHDPAKVPQVMHVRELPTNAADYQAIASAGDGKLAAYVRIDLYDPSANVPAPIAPIAKAVAGAVIFVPTE